MIIRLDQPLANDYSEGLAFANDHPDQPDSSSWSFYYSANLLVSSNKHHILSQNISSSSSNLSIKGSISRTFLKQVFLFNEWYHKIALYIFWGVRTHWKTQIQVAFRWGNLWSLQWWSLRRRGKPWRPEGNLQYWFNDNKRLQCCIYRFWDHCCQMILNNPTAI